MSQDRPTASELLLAVRELVEKQLLPEAQGGRAFQLRVAANVLGIVERELRLASDQDGRERVRLAELLGHDGPLDALQRELCARIRAGSLDDQREQVLAFARVLTNDKLQIANPGYR